MELVLGDVQTTALIPLAIRGKLFALFFPKFNDRWATFEW